MIELEKSIQNLNNIPLHNEKEVSRAINRLTKDFFKLKNADRSEPERREDVKRPESFYEDQQTPRELKPIEDLHPYLGTKLSNKLNELIERVNTLSK